MDTAPIAATDTPSYPRLRSFREVATQTGMAESWWRKQVRARAIRVYRLGDRTLLADADVAGFLAARAAQPRPRGGPAQPAGGAE